MEKGKLLVSIIIATRNEERNVENCIRSIQKQTYPPDLMEIIVVDNDSQDRTRAIAEKLTGKVYNLPEHVSLERVKNFRGAQVNLGVNQCNGDIIFFPDADMTLDPNLIANAVDEITQNGMNALYVPEIICGHGFFGRIRRFERSFYDETCIDAVRIVRKVDFLKVSGFDCSNIAFGPDDWDLTKALKKNDVKLGTTAYPLYHHEEWMTVRMYLEKKAKYTVTFDDYVRKWGKDDPDIRKQFGFGYRYFGVFLENRKWMRLLLHPVLTLGVYLFRFMVGIAYITRKKSQ